MVVKILKKIMIEFIKAATNDWWEMAKEINKYKI